MGSIALIKWLLDFSVVILTSLRRVLIYILFLLVDFIYPITGLDSPVVFAACSEQCCQFPAVPRIWQPAILSS